MEQRYSLCPSCDACPEVVIEREAVTIGEGGNAVRLTADEWNVLVTAIRSRELTVLPTPGDDGASSGRNPCCGGS